MPRTHKSKRERTRHGRLYSRLTFAGSLPRSLAPSLPPDPCAWLTGGARPHLEQGAAGLPGFPQYADLAGKGAYTVTYDKRSLIVAGKVTCWY